MFTSARFGAPASAPTFHSDARSERLFHEHRKLANCANAYVAAHPELVALGDDPVVSHLVAAAGFAATDIVILRVVAKGRMVTALCVPTRLWRDPPSRARLLELKREAEEIRTTCILVPQRWIKAETRGAVARAIAQARHTRYSHSQMNAVFNHLRQVKISSLAEAASVLVDHDDPFGVILSMCAQGFVDVDRSTPLRASSWISTRR